MRKVHELKDNDLKDMVILEQQAYTAFAKENAEELYQIVEKYKNQSAKDDKVHFYGYFDNSKLLGSMRLYDFQMNAFGQWVPTGGVGSVAVDLLHKKEKIAKELIAYFLNFYYKKGYSMTALYPFRPDFYYKMGFGYGTKKDQYRISPDAFPNFKIKQDLAYLTEDDLSLLLDCYTKYAEKNHGCMMNKKSYYEGTLKNFKFKVVAVKKNNRVTGYAIFSFRKQNEGNFLLNNIIIHEFVYLDRDALHQLSTFFHTQNDQVNRIIFPTQDLTFHHFLHDARDGSDELIPSVYHRTNSSGVGLMYRVINVQQFFQEQALRNFNHVTHTVTFRIKDTFFEENAKDVTVKFVNGKPTVVQREMSETVINIDIADFSSLVMGVVGFKQLFTYGKVSISNEEHVEKLEDLFHAKEKPICLTGF